MVTRTDDMKRVRDQMQDDITEVGRIAHKAKGRLEALDKANEAAQRKAVRAAASGRTQATHALGSERAILHGGVYSAACTSAPARTRSARRGGPLPARRERAGRRAWPRSPGLPAWRSALHVYRVLAALHSACLTLHAFLAASYQHSYQQLPPRLHAGATRVLCVMDCVSGPPICREAAREQSERGRRGVQGCGPGSSSERTRTAVTAALKKKLKDIMGDFQVLRQRLNEEYRCAAAV
jgi:hypothetical protein